MNPDPKDQVFFCIDSDGYCVRLKPKTPFEKQYMYKEYPFVIQTGFRTKDRVQIDFYNREIRLIDPNKYPIGRRHFLSRNKIQTISLEPREVNK